jgi:flagellar biosynthesis GTPase FlhF
MPRIAISYRREDSAAVTGRIFDRLTAQYGADSVFRDIDNIPLGVDFREHINAMLAETDITLVVIGKRWLGPGRGRRRINDPVDPVRVEVETALRIGNPVIPVLVEGGGMPKADQLPDTLKDLIYRNGLDVDSGRDFDQHIERLIRNIDPILARISRQRAEVARQAEEEKQRAEAARQAEEERQRAEAARQAEEERQRAEAARWAKEQKQRAEAARQVEEEKRRAEAARQAESL